MSIDFNKFGKSPNATATPPMVATSAVPTPTAPTPSATVKSGKIDFNKFGKSGGYTSPTPLPEDKSSIDWGELAKGIVRAPATLIARPFQLGAAIAGYDEDQIDKFSKEKLGGFVAPVVRGSGKYGMVSADDLIKEGGRAVQTVALGLGPLAGGLSFGAGSSAERQGKELFTPSGAVEGVGETLIGGAGGKLGQLIGKPLLSATGKVIGTITPKTIQDMAGKTTAEIADFVARHEILPAEGKAAVATLERTANKVDDKIGSLFTGAKDKITEGVSSQYPDFKKKGQNYYENVEVDRLMAPSKEAGKAFNKSSDLLKQAEKRGVDVRKTLANNKIYASEHITDGKFDTEEIADALANEAKNGGAEFLRPALAEAQGGVQRIPLEEIRVRMLRRLGNTPDSVLSPEQKKVYASHINEEYAPGSITAMKYKDGYDLTNLYDSKLQTSSKLYKEPKNGGQVSIADSQTAQRKKVESDVFDELLRENVPKEMGLDEYFKAQEAKFITANYLRTLDGKKAPQSLFQRGTKKASQLIGATAGADVAGPFGMFSGYQFGGIAADTFATMPNPVKIAFLKSIGKTDPEIYQVMKEYTGGAEAARLKRALLGEGSEVDRNWQPFKNERGAIPMKGEERPLTEGEVFNNNITQNQRLFNNTKFLTPPSERIILPNTQGTPNILGRPYKSGEQGDVGGMRQRIPRPKPKK